MPSHTIAGEPPKFGSLLARAYSRYWGDYSRAMVGNLGKIARRFGFSYHTVADIACGEGAFALGTARDGREVYAVDFSEDMLAIGREREADYRKRGVPLDRPVTWLRQDIRQLDLPLRVDVVTCWYNSLNYLTDPSDLLAVLRCVRDSLVPEGVLLFDVYTIDGLASEWSDQVRIAVDTEDSFIASRTRYIAEDHLATVRFTGFVRDGDKYARFDETHHNRGYERKDIEAMLWEAGLEHMGTFTLPGMRKPARNAPRLVMLARRPRDT